MIYIYIYKPRYKPLFLAHWDIPFWGVNYSDVTRDFAQMVVRSNWRISSVISGFFQVGDVFFLEKKDSGICRYLR